MSVLSKDQGFAPNPAKGRGLLETGYFNIGELR
jgi:hypothetical protein